MCLAVDLTVCRGVLHAWVEAGTAHVGLCARLTSNIVLHRGRLIPCSLHLTVWPGLRPLVGPSLWSDPTSCSANQGFPLRSMCTSRANMGPLGQPKVACSLVCRYRPWKRCLREKIWGLTSRAALSASCCASLAAGRTSAMTCQAIGVSACTVLETMESSCLACPFTFQRHHWCTRRRPHT